MKPARTNRFVALTSSASSLTSAARSRQGNLRRLASIPSLVLLLAGAPSAQAADFFWDPGLSGTNTGSGAGVWNAANTNWFNGTTDVIWASGNRPVFGGADGPFGVTVADNFSTTGLLFNKTAYTLSAASAQTITTTGNTALASGVTATIGSNVTVTRAANDLITTVSGAGGTLNIGGADQLSTGAQFINTQSGSTGTRTLSITNGTLVNVNSGGYLGQAPGTVYDTAINPNGTSIVMGSATGGSLVVKAGGTVTNGNNQALILGGAAASGTLTIDGGQVNAGTVTVGVSGNLPAASIYAGLRFGAGSANASGTRTASLNGGTLTVGQIYTGTAAASPTFTNTFNFNGGILQASIANTTFMTGLTTANVQVNGAKIDTNTFDITIGQALVHDAALGATLDGGLTKSSSGTLTLTAANTYDGGTTISDGALLLSGSGSLAAAGPVSLAPGTTLEKANGSAQNLTGAITGNGTLKLSAGGSFALTNASNSFGALTISHVSARVFINTNAAALPSTATVAVNAGLLVFGAASSSSTAITVSSGAGIAARATTTLSNVTLPGSGSVVFNNDDANTASLTISNGLALTGSLTVQVGGTRMLATGGAIGGVNLSGNLTGSGPLVMASSGNVANPNFGTGILTLSGANTYSGDTTVDSGTLRLGTGTTNTSLADSAGVFIGTDSTAFLDLNYSGTDTVAALTINGVAKASGIWGSSTSGAPNTDPKIKGSGTLTVASGPSAGFSSWITGTFANGTVPALKQGPNDDADNDGISNLVEYAVAGQDPTVGNPTISTITGGIVSFTKRAGTGGLTYAIQDSTDLGITDAWAEVSGGSYVNNATTISYTLTPGTPAKNFVRLQVTQTP